MHMQFDRDGGLRIVRDDVLAKAAPSRPAARVRETAAGRAFVQAQRYTDLAKAMHDPAQAEAYRELAQRELAKAGLE